MDTEYSDESELLKQANLLLNKSVFDLYGNKAIDQLANKKGKGKFGQIIEELHYGIRNNNRSEPDIKNLDIEIKTNPLKRKNDGTFSPKEVVSLGMINFTELIKEDFQTSNFLKKNERILYNMYLYESKSQAEANYKFVLIHLRCIPPNDLKVIQKDWELIRDRARNGLANELSKADTKYLAAGTKGSANQKPSRYTANGKTYFAKSRAMVFKTAYVRNIIEEYQFNESKEIFEYEGKKERFSLFNENFEDDIEVNVASRFRPYYGLSDIDIARHFGFDDVFHLEKDKSRWHYNTSLILTGKRKKFLSRYIEEFSKSGLTVKTIRVDNKLKPMQEVSFRTQSYSIDSDAVWEESTLYEELSTQFLWVVYQKREDEMILKTTFFWSMPKNDLFVVEKRWNELKAMIAKGDYRPSYFMTRKGFYYLKIKDNKGGANKQFNDTQVTNLSHWFRKSYVQDVILKQESKIQ